MLHLLKLAAKIAQPSKDVDYMKNFWLGCVGIRNDGVIVSARNMGVIAPDVDNFRPDVRNHCEARCLRKMNKHRDGVLYVSRISKIDGEFKMARPCSVCRPLIQAHNIRKVYYSINNSQYGVWLPYKDSDRVFRT